MRCMFGMDGQNPTAGPSYQLLGTCRDGTSITLLSALTLEDANHALSAIEESGIFAVVEVVADSAARNATGH